MPRVVNKKAVAVAQDALKWLSMARFLMSGSSYLSQVYDTPKFDPQVDLGAQSARAIRNCRMCMLGACLVAKARVFDEVPVGQLLSWDGSSVAAHRSDIVNNLAGIFSSRALNMIEAAFEVSKEVDRRRVPDTDWDAAQVFGARFSIARRRAREIFKEIIRQGGEFDPHRALRYLDRAKRKKAKVVS